MEDLAKPSGISLRDHTRHVWSEAKYLLQTWPFLAEKYERLIGAELIDQLRLAVRYHDAGKAHTRWQQACQADFEAYLKWRSENGYPSNHFDWREYKFYTSRNSQAGENLMKAGLRHEFASLEVLKREVPDASEAVRCAIAAHHGKLAYRHQHRWEKDGREPRAEKGPFLSYWEDFVRLKRDLSLEPKPTKEAILQRYEFDAIRALLQLADTRASRMEGEGKEALPDLIAFTFNNPFASLRPVQRAAVEISSEPISILRAPTGSGKTHASLLWGQEQIAQGKADRLVIAMPTRFTSNALAINIRSDISRTGLYHSSAWNAQYGELTDGSEINNAKEAHRMAQYLATPVTVCTIDHLMIALAGGKEAHHATFFFLANSAVVFDEADFYDPFVQANMVVLLQVLRWLNVPILIMSATVPDSARKLYGIAKPIKEAVRNGDSGKTASDSQTQRGAEAQAVYRRNLHFAGDAESPGDVAFVLDKMREQGNGIVYCNTISRALTFYYWLLDRNEVRPTGNEVPIILYHSRFTEPHKKDIEVKLIKTLGSEAWEEKTKSVRGIAVLTQIGEMSVNISSSLMLSDACPWDRLAQRLGRLSRFDPNARGDAYVMVPQKEGKDYVAPYGEYDQANREWVAYESFTASLDDFRKIHPEKGHPITDDDLVERVNTLYPKPPLFEGNIKTNQRNYSRHILNNWLIVPDTSVDEENAEVGSWSSRSIPPQVDVFVEDPISFGNYRDFFDRKLASSVSCPSYLLKRGGELRPGIKLVEREIRKSYEEAEKVHIYLTTNYHPEVGLAFLYSEDPRAHSHGNSL